jgi:hypothetical protein
MYSNSDRGPAAGYPASRKSKLLSVLLSMAFPGTGHLYIGQLPRGLGFSLLFIANIMFIVLMAMSELPFKVPVLVFLGLLLPVIYLVNLFDSAHHTDAVNAASRGFMPHS